MKILCIGNISYDITYQVNEFPQENIKQRIDNRTECGGGPAATAAYLLGKWGQNSVYFAGVVGNDDHGKRIKEEFKAVGVNINYLEINHHIKTTLSFVISNLTNGSRTILTNRADNLEMNDVDFRFTPDIILIDGQEVSLSNKVLAKYPQALSIIDAGRARPEIIELAHKVNYLVCSREFAEEVTNYKLDYTHESLTELYRRMESIFNNNNIVITLEAHGCLYKNANKLFLMPIIATKTVDSTGAGDIFHGAFTYGISKQWDIEKIIKTSTIAAGLSVTKVGTRYAVPTAAEMKAYYNDFE